jgi:hypothetical protein
VPIERSRSGGAARASTVVRAVGRRELNKVLVLAAGVIVAAAFAD